MFTRHGPYNNIFGLGERFADNCNSDGERKANFAVTPFKTWDVKLFPNPASTQVNIVSSKQSEDLHVEISDVIGRNMMNQTLRTKYFIVNLDLGLINGAYLIIITNNNHESVTKKLLIVK